jgi:hypothetical protein
MDNVALRHSGTSWCDDRQYGGGTVAVADDDGRNFRTMDATVHEALVKEAMATSVEATMEHFERIELFSMRRAGLIIDHYKERSKKFDLDGPP